MRVIAGDLRGTKLESPKDNRIRPTNDKVKEALFSIIMNNTYDRCFCDLFSGTGNLAIEALSRGARRVFIGDNSRESVNLIKRNLAHCKILDEAVVIAGDFSVILNKIHLLEEKIDVFLLDPPYGKGLIAEAIKMIREKNILSDEGIIVAEHGIEEELPDVFEGYIKYKSRKYGKIILDFYKEN